MRMVAGRDEGILLYGEYGGHKKRKGKQIVKHGKTESKSA